MNFDIDNPDYFFYYMKLKDNIFSNENERDIIICKEMPRYLVVSEYLKQILFKANVRGLQFSDSIDITPKLRTKYDKI